ncbi:MAG: signal recognition particle-docking protein FtsY [Candidatus Pacebacteria bacterium]|jgi:fused signal recognition particle receptor|nr:signal recognition particle-docking protein FtsY [Candidatus Paceibacterota bacterium]
MFGKLKEKLKSWTQGIIKKAVVDEVEEVAKKEKAKKSEKQVKDKKEAKVKERSKKEKKESKRKEKEAEEIVQEIEEKEKAKEEIKSIEEHEYVEPKLKAFDKEERKISEKIIEDIKVEEEEKKGFFKKIFSGVNKIKISEEDFEAYSGDLEMILIENNVALEVSDKIIKQLRDTLVGKEFLKKEIEGQIKESLKDIIHSVLIEPFDLIEKIKDKKLSEHKPYVILFCGINGTGKTTSIAKFGNLLKEKKLSCVFAAGDTFRAASIEQLKKHGTNLGIEVIAHDYGSDPASVGFDAIKYAEKNHIDVVLIDTAGRMHTEKNLMAQVEKIAKVCNPDTKLFVGESITGNDIIEQIKTFNQSVKIDGIILSKADIDEKGGTALSVGYTTEKPILYLGVGQEYKDLQKFDKNKFVESLGL